MGLINVDEISNVIAIAHTSQGVSGKSLWHIMLLL